MIFRVKTEEVKTVDFPHFHPSSREPVTRVVGTNSDQDLCGCDVWIDVKIDLMF